jgi:hypothetical protein
LAKQCAAARAPDRRTISLIDAWQEFGAWLALPAGFSFKNIWTEEQLATDLAKMLARASKSTEAA